MDTQVALFDDEEQKREASTFCESWPTSSLRHPGWLRGLMGVPGIGPKTCIEIAGAFPYVDDLRNTPEVEVARRVGKRVPSLELLRFVDSVDIEGVSVVGYFDHEYPEALIELSDAPPVLWVRGSVPRRRAITIVGTREASNWGINVATKAGEIAAKYDVDVISGLAIGIDAASHRGAVQSGGRTTAVLGSGIDNVTPKQNQSLAFEILEQNGCLISEVEPGTKPSALTLVSRNRLQAALGSALLMVECGIPSGTLHTVRYAFKLGKKIAVPRPYKGQVRELPKGNEALLSIEGISGSVLGAGGQLSARIESSKPFASAIDGLQDLDAFVSRC